MLAVAVRLVASGPVQLLPAVSEISVASACSPSSTAKLVVLVRLDMLTFPACIPASEPFVLNSVPSQPNSAAYGSCSELESCVQTCPSTGPSSRVRSRFVTITPVLPDGVLFAPSLVHFFTAAERDPLAARAQPGDLTRGAARRARDRTFGAQHLERHRTGRRRESGTGRCFKRALVCLRGLRRTARVGVVALLLRDARRGRPRHPFVSALVVSLKFHVGH